MARPKKKVEELKDGWIRDQHPNKPEEEKPVKEKKVKLFTYSIKMVIPTGAYANIQPEIVVKGGTLEEAHAYCAPHMNKLWKEYYMISEKRVEPKITVEHTYPPLATTPAPKLPTAEEIQNIPQPPASSVALSKATQAIQSCLSFEALDLIANQVEVSVKLTNEDKAALMPLLDAKFKELTK